MLMINGDKLRKKTKPSYWMFTMGKCGLSLTIQIAMRTFCSTRQLWLHFEYRLVRAINFKHQPYEIGVVYLAIMNLPCHIKYRSKVIILGLIPGHREPKLSIDTYLEPHVHISDLLSL